MDLLRSMKARDSISRWQSTDQALEQLDSLAKSEGDNPLLGFWHWRRTGPSAFSKAIPDLYADAELPIVPHPKKPKAAPLGTSPGNSTRASVMAWTLTPMPTTPFRC